MGTTNKTHVKRVQKIKNFCAKVALGGKSRRDRASPILQERGWLNIDKRCTCKQIIMTQRFHEYISPLALQPAFCQQCKYLKHDAARRFVYTQD